MVLAIVVSAAGDDSRAEFEYVDQLQAHSVELAKAGDAMRDVISRLQRIDRSEFVTVMNGITADLEEAAAFAEQQPPGEQLLSHQVLYGEALAAWMAGVDGYESSVLLAADEPDNTQVVDLMADALAELRTGDSVYAELLVVMAAEELPQPPALMPEVSLMPAQAGLVTLATAYVDSARSINSGLALRPGLKVSMIVSDPEWQVDPNGIAVIPATNEVEFSIVLTNVGNVPSSDDDLVITLTGSSEPIRDQVVVIPLEPDQQRTMIVGPFAVEPGGLYEVTAALAISENDSDFSDNTLVVEFKVNEE